MSEVDIDSGRVDAVLDAQWAVLSDGAFELLQELGFGNDLFHAAFQYRKLFGDIPHRALTLLSDGSAWGFPGSARCVSSGTNVLPILEIEAGLDKVADRESSE